MAVAGSIAPGPEIRWGSEEAATRRTLEAARRVQEASQRERSSSAERDSRVAALTSPPPLSFRPTDDTRIVGLERQIAELKLRPEAGAADGSRAAASKMPGWAPWAAALPWWRSCFRWSGVDGVLQSPKP